MIKKIDLNSKNIKNKENNAQMIILAGITIAVLIVSLAAISANVSNIGIGLSFERSISPLEEYENLRHVFINVFNSSCAGRNNQYMIREAFNYTKNVLSKIEIRYGNYFSAELKDIETYHANTLDVTANLKLISKNTRIEEEIRIPIRII